jgi:hypothetical protein
MGSHISKEWKTVAKWTVAGLVLCALLGSVIGLAVFCPPLGCTMLAWGVVLGKGALFGGIIGTIGGFVAGYVTAFCNPSVADLNNKIDEANNKYDELSLKFEAMEMQIKHLNGESVPTYTVDNSGDDKGSIQVAKLNEGNSGELSLTKVGKRLNYCAYKEGQDGCLVTPEYGFECGDICVCEAHSNFFSECPCCREPTNGKCTRIYDCS